MAEIIPFKGWVYHPSLHSQIDQLTSPPFDVISSRHREKLYRNPQNSIHLSVPNSPTPAESASETFSFWKNEQVILEDAKPAFYAYYQYFNLHGDTHLYCRKGFVCLMKAYFWEDEIIRRHENTIPGAVNDRIELLRQTGLNVSPTHGLYTDTEHQLEPFLDEAIQSPLFDTEDYQGVRDVMARITDPETITYFQELLKNKKIILADGHHRYESSLTYRRERTQQNPNHSGEELYNYHLIYLTNTEAEDLRVLPTHRLASNLGKLDEDELLAKTEKYFTIREVGNPNDLGDIIAGKKWAYGLITKKAAYKIRLRPEVFEQLNWKFPEIIKEMDLTVLHFFMIEKVLGILGRFQRASDQISYERNFTECLFKVIRGDAQIALITNEIPMSKIKEVCESGFTMPPKSTFFYPKVICGFVFAKIS